MSTSSSATSSTSSGASTGIGSANWSAASAPDSITAPLHGSGDAEAQSHEDADALPGPAQPDKNSHKGGQTRVALRRAFKIVLIIIACVAVILLARLAWHGYTGYQTARALMGVVGQSGRMAGGELIMAAYPHVQELHATALAVEGDLRLTVLPLFQGASILPWVGETAGVVPALADAGRGMLDVGMDALAAIAASAQTHPDAGLLQVVSRSIEESPQVYADLGGRATQIRLGLDQIDTHHLAGFATSPVLQVQAVARLMEAGLHVSHAAPQLLGFDGPSTFLLLVQNNHELRPTGGFISALGTVTLDGGSLGDLEIKDSYQVVNHTVDHPPAPEAMRRYMGIELIFVRDANWSPDFPTTASLVRGLYAQDVGVAVDGVIAIDLHAVQNIIHALGPIELEGADEPVTGETFVEQIIQFWEAPIDSDVELTTGEQDNNWWRQRKDFMPLLAQAALEKVRSGNINPLALAHAAVVSLDSGSIQAWFPDQELARTLNNFDWDGRVAAPVGVDYIAPVDTNLGYNKVDAVLTRGLEYGVEWHDGQATATATLHYHHPALNDDPVCEPDAHYQGSYTEMTQRCYFNFVRLFVPRGSELVSIEGVEPDSIAVQPQLGPNNTTVFGGYFSMQPGTAHQVRFIYILPPTISPDEYALTIRRQAGTGPLPVVIRLGENSLSTILEETHLNWNPGLD